MPPAEIVVPGEPCLVLRAITEHDGEIEQALSRVEDVPRWTFYPADLGDDDARRRAARAVERSHAGLAQRYVISRQDEAVGTAGLTALDGDTPAVFYALLPSARGAGVATRVVLALVEHALASGARGVRLFALAGNAASEGVARRAGFTFVEERPDEIDGAPTRLWVR